jgi:N-acetyl-anhydromuramyl-L-alanine amidase AmpD
VSAVDGYRATVQGDRFICDEQLKSSFVFGGTGAKIHEHYNVQGMDARLESINLHSTGDERHKTELDTINEFSGHFLIDAEQSIPGYKHIEDRQEFFGNFTVSKHLLFRRPDEPVFDWP